jgi:hypothetical protein
LLAGTHPFGRDARRPALPRAGRAQAGSSRAAPGLPRRR